MRTPLDTHAPRVLAHLRGLFTAETADFWTRLRIALRAQGCELLMMADEAPQGPLDVPLLRVPGDLDKPPPFPPQEGWRPWLMQQRDFDIAPYMARHRAWYGLEADDDDPHVCAAIHHFDHFYRLALQTAQPALLLMFNGSMAREYLCCDAARQAGIPIRYLERGPFPGTLHLDDEGILGNSRTAREAAWTWRDNSERVHWHSVFDDLTDRAASARETWWEQPRSVGTEKLRAQLRIPAGRTVVLFAGQVDCDAQNILFAPNFRDNLHALEWFMSALGARDDVFVLGKHHPRSPTSPEQFERAIDGRGAWLRHAALEDCLALCDRVAAVNSTVLYEGLMAGKPGLALGDGLFAGKGFLYELRDLDTPGPVLDAWLQARDVEQRRERWRDFAAHLIAHALYTTRPPEQTGGLRGIDALASELCRACAAPGVPNYAALGAPWPAIDEIARWQQAHEQRHTGAKEVLRGLNISTKALLGRRAPTTYAWLLRTANRLWARRGA